MTREVYDEIDLTVFALSNYGPDSKYHKAVDEALTIIEHNLIIDEIKRRLAYGTKAEK